LRRFHGKNVIAYYTGMSVKKEDIFEALASGINFLNEKWFQLKIGLVKKSNFNKF